MLFDNYVSQKNPSKRDRSRSPTRSNFRSFQNNDGPKHDRGRVTNYQNKNEAKHDRGRVTNYHNKDETKHDRRREMNKRSNSPERDQSRSAKRGNYKADLPSSVAVTELEFIILNINKELGEQLLIPMLKDCDQFTHYINRQGKFVLRFRDGEIGLLLAKALNGVRFPDRNLLIEQSDSILRANVTDLKLDVMKHFVSDGLKNNQHHFIDYWQSLSKSSEGE